MRPDYEHLSAVARDDLRMLARNMQEGAVRLGKHNKGDAEASGVFLAVYRLSIAIENYTKLNGHLEIWATFVPLMPFFDEEGTVGLHE